MTQVSLAKDRIKFLLLEGVHESAVNILKQRGYHNIQYIKTALTEDELCGKISDAHFVGIRSRTELSERVFAAAEKLIGVGCFCIGTNQVDLQAARRHGVVVFNAPFSNTRSVAELVLAEIIMLLRRVPEKNAAAHRGGWDKSAAGSYEARGKVLGIVGYGHIGSQLSILAEQLGMQVRFYDIESKLPLGNAHAVGSLDELLQQADVVTLHVPETAQTQWMIDAPQLAKMKKGALLINASRGTVVVIDALAEALRTGQLAGAAIDVFPVEPGSNNEVFESPLRHLDNCILTPHVGGSTQEAQENIGVEVAGKLAHYSDNGSTLSAVNFPEVSLPTHHGARRLLHIHENRPGMLTRINQLLAEQSINVSGQYLQTDADLGYVVIDIDTPAESDIADTLLDSMRAIEGTIRARVLY
ncbi:phosphoglycerate dehydrogenase [Pseudidiomarina sp. E22-M8]|uniref:phosphoglycerate dehydrogenase n=1 Tax=Pseudidiomarina sp. E22-M8 TaxID=3424768 RepID=UPI00403C7EE2